MSEQLDVEVNNLCIPEDAFEKFQAVSMYQEEECIMLPQKEPQNPKPPEPDENNSPPTITEVVVSSCNEVNNSVNSENCKMDGFEEPLSNPCVESSADVSGLSLLGQEDGSSLIDSDDKVQIITEEYSNENNTDMIVSNSENVNNLENTMLETLTVKSHFLPRKRGRKPKNISVRTEEFTALDISKHIQNPDISSTPFSSDPEMPETVIVIKKKRGRPRKVPHEQNNTTPNISDKDAASELSSSDNNRTDDSFIKKTMRGTRGRPKGSGKKLPQLINQGQLPSSQSQIKEDLMPRVEASENLNMVNEISKKRKQKSRTLNLEKTYIEDNNIHPNTNKILSGNISGDDDLDDIICLSKLKSVPDQSNLTKSGEGNVSTDYKIESSPSVLKDVSSESIEGQPSKLKKKRGRPKKKMAISEFIEGSEPVADHVDIYVGSDIKHDDADDMCLSELKTISDDAAPEAMPEMPGSELHDSVVLEAQVSEVPSSDINIIEIPDNAIQVSDIEHCNSESNETPTKRNTKMPVMADFEYNVDSVLENENVHANNSLLVEDTSKRPIRRKIKKLKYQEESDEDPFANIELSDDEPRRGGRKGNKYYSDDEYIPGARGAEAVATSTDTEISDSGMHNKSEDNKKQRRRKLRKKSDTQSPRKRSKKDDDQTPIISNVTSLEQNELSYQSNDIEICLEPAVTKTSDGESQHSQPSQWGTTTEFENFLAKKIQGTNLKIKKVPLNVPSENNKMEIPVLDPEAKKAIEMCTQTNLAPKTSKAVQTVTPYDIPMKENITLTSEQSEKACHFLSGIVKTTAELGLLMTQKSEDFIKKKINTGHVTDTFKMDYCVKKSFLLFKLAKHNLLQMEEDLAKQYDQFLETQNLTRCREEQKKVLPTPKEASSDSDCEIVDVKPSPKPKTPQKAPVKPAFNPKTVFLNKELSIKIAKKPNENKKIDIKGRHTVWINDTVMVKKVKPTQSFLAQDSRNKKPPDNFVTTEMVSNFFKDYYRERVLYACAPFVSIDWLYSDAECICNYFVVKPPQYKTDSNYSNDGFISLSTPGSTRSEPSPNLSGKSTAVSSPDTLFRLCFHKLKNQLFCEELNHLKEITYETRHDLTDMKKGPVSLFRLCLRTINDITTNDNITNKMEICPTSSKPEAHTESICTYTTLPLKSLCHRRIVGLLTESNHFRFLTSFQEMELETGKNKNGIQSLFTLCVEHFRRIQHILQTEKNKYRCKSLFSLCVEYIQRIQHVSERKDIIMTTPQPLKQVALESVKLSLYNNKESETEGLMINCVNTLSEEAFLSLEQYNTDIPDSSEYLDDFDNEDNFEPDFTEAEDDQTVPSWASQVQMHELRSCVNINNTDVNEYQAMEPIITHIKLEPLDDITDNLLDSVLVKTEPPPGPDEMTIIPDVKPEIDEHINAGPILRQNSNSYDENAFEQFVSCNKLMRSSMENNTDEIYSQSSARVRKQHEPDHFTESNPDMLGLLVPHAYTPISIQTAKGSLMESSSDESNKNIKSAPKRAIKRSKGRPKKSEHKTNNKDTPTPVLASTATSSTIPAPTKEKEKQRGTSSEVAILTRKMREKIRQEEKKNVSTDSENESVTVRLRSREKKDTSDQTKDKIKSSSKGKNSEIQCSNVDSTDQLDENIGTFTGFTSIETNEMCNYEKYMKFVYNKIIPEKEDEVNGSSLATNKNIKDTAQMDSNDKYETPLIEPNEPVELLECEPTLPIFDEDINAKAKKVTKSKTKVTKKGDAGSSEVTIPPFIDRHGWECYPVDSSDSKLYHNACIYLEKLPESFVQTYFQYQNIATKDESDEEINRLTNLNTLNRATHLKDRKSQNSKRDKDDITGHVTDDDSRTVSAVDSDHFNELLPSDDEGLSVEDEVPPPVIKHTENTLAKDLLMDDNESDEDGGVRVKKEPIERSGDIEKPKPLSKKKAAIKTEEPTMDLMLTADKMMNKELTLLHAPVVMDQKVTLSKGPVTRQNKKNGTKPSPTNNKMKAEEDSSSEEEKQWVSTKEKLLKRMGKKESASADDAKRAKLVSEFIERREGNPDSRKSRGVKGRRSGKRFLERQKQLRVLQRELFGETSNDPTVSKRSGAAWKGRRNIRKVLDKKSLARSTVIANMEEFERKRRLNARQTKLRELLGCEEGVNVLVINDEVCLEYDFEEHHPVVTIHPFFTKVMKAHQYEGVKFMWDACFESLADIEAGHAGGGCILAHCMGLGKTLQVLALLHTVLTHPRVGMRRVLVCCPLSTVLNWVDEIHKWIGPVTNQIKVFELSKLKKTYERAYQLEDWYNGGGIFIIGYELFRSLSTLDPLLDDIRPTIVNKIRTALLDPGPDIIVCDEGHLLKNDCSVLAVSMSRVVTKRRIVLTGTPMQNNLREYYCMVNFVKPNLLGTYSEYSNRFENPIMNGQHRDSREEDIKLMKARTHILHKVLEGCLQRQEVSVLYPYLPKKHEYTVFITLTKCQWDLYKHYLNHYSKQNKHNSILRDFHILQKIWSHPQVLHNFQTKAQDARNKLKLEKLEDDLATEDHREIKEDIATELWWLPYLEGGDMLDSLEVSNKFVVVFRILDECVALGDKVLIFSTSLFCLDALEYFLKKINKWSLGQEYYRLDGSVPAEVRQKWCREFNAENNVNTKVFLVSTRAGCLGLNMTAANRVIIMDTSWNPAHDIQSIFRVYRFGQKKDCFIYRLVALGTMEQKIYERSVTKQAVACRVVDEQQIDRHYNMAELTELYRYDEAGVSVAGGVAVGVSDVALLRVARETALHAVHEHDSLLRSSEQGLPEHERAAAWMQFQQEQAHKQMENKLITNIPKISLKRLQGDNYSQSFELNDFQIKSDEIKVEDTTGEFVPPNEIRSKRGRKIKVVIPVAPKPHGGRPVGRPPGKSIGRPLIGPTGRPVGRPPKTSTQVHPEEPGPSTNPTQYMDKQHYNEEMMIHKITEILIKHNFQNRQANTDITSLVTKVRKIVNQGYIFKDDSTDDLTSSIAKVLLSKRMSMPTLTGIMCESINKSNSSSIAEEEPELILSTSESAVTVADSRRKRKTPIAAAEQAGSPGIAEEEPELILSTSESAVTVADNRRKRKAANAAAEQAGSPGIAEEEPELILSTSESAVPVADSRRKRKAAIAAEKNIDSIAHDVIIDLDDDFDATDSEFVPDIIVKHEKSQLNKRKQSLKETTPKKTYGSEQIKTYSNSPLHFSTSDTFNNTTEPISILGDTDTTNNEKPVTKPKSKPRAGPKTYKDKLKKKSQEVTTNEGRTSGERRNNILLSDEDEPLAHTATTMKDAAPIAPEDTDIVPLPLSLLTNKNFINIVAHTYLNGNPMLAADAATLAAQYSTFKSLKEAEETGRDIISGPIYDIAVKVIGKKLFHKMNNVNMKTNTLSVEEANVTIELKKKMQEMSQGESVEVKKEKTRKKKAASSDSLNSNLLETDSLQPIASQYANGNVVPVGLIKTTGSIQSNEFASSECILPDDDDDMHIVPHDFSALQQLQPATGLHLRLTTPQPSRASPQPPPGIAPTNPAPIHINHVFDTKQMIRKGQMIIPASVTSGTNAQVTIATAPPPLTLSDDTICLDSDEEETITPTIMTPSLPGPQANLIVVPSSFTVEHNEIPSTPSSITPTFLTQGTPQNTGLVLRQVGSDGAQKFVLVPASSIPTSNKRIAVSQLPSSITVPKLCNIVPKLARIAPKLSSNITDPKLSSSVITPKLSKSNIVSKLSTSHLPSNLSSINTAPSLSRTNAASKLSKILAKEKTTPQSVQQTPNTTIQQTESILSTTTPSTVSLSKLQQARCKPGDIIRISETGEIIVLPVNKLKTVEKLSPSDVKPKPGQSETTKLKSSSDTAKPKSSQSGAAKAKSSQSNVAKSKISNNGITKAKGANSILKPKQIQGDVEIHRTKPQTKKNSGISDSSKILENQPTKTRTLSISSSSGESRSASPVDDNPLSILKNVVHIQAADDATNTLHEHKSKVTRNQKSDATHVQHVHASESKISPKPAAAKIGPAQNKESKTTKVLPKSKDVAKPSSSKTTSGLDKIKANLLLSNLLSKKFDNMLTSSASGSKTVDFLSSKLPNNKTYHTVDLTQAPTVTVGSGASILMTKIEAKKRVSTAETSAPKKKKGELPTLKDFSLDDIDDIIELE